jgi:hypothetical protein
MPYLRYKNIYCLIEELDEIESSYSEIYFFLKDVIINGTEYETFEKKLYKDGFSVVYTYVSDEEKERDRQRRNELKEKVPFVGLEEEYISCTSLGAPDEKEYCRDFSALRASHQSIYYRWYNSNGDLICSATVRGWDFKKDKVVDNYVSSVTFFKEYSHYNE